MYQTLMDTALIGCNCVKYNFIRSFNGSNRIVDSTMLRKYSTSKRTLSNVRHDTMILTWDKQIDNLLLR